MQNAICKFYDAVRLGPSAAAPAAVGAREPEEEAALPAPPLFVQLSGGVREQHRLELLGDGRFGKVEGRVAG